MIGVMVRGRDGEDHSSTPSKAEKEVISFRCSEPLEMRAHPHGEGANLKVQFPQHERPGRTPALHTGPCQSQQAWREMGGYVRREMQADPQT